MGCFAVIDTETNWHDQVMSIGTVLADDRTFQVIGIKYHILPAESRVGGMYTATLHAKTPVPPVLCRRDEALGDLRRWFQHHGVQDVFAYNACFDRSHLPELGNLRWHDIMRLAAYRQYNHHIPPHADCCATGRLKRGYGVEAMLRLLTGNAAYHESHNACLDALDELQIMRLLGYAPAQYECL